MDIKVNAIDVDVLIKLKFKWATRAVRILLRMCDSADWLVPLKHQNFRRNLETVKTGETERD